MKCLVAIVFLKSVPNGVESELIADLIDAKNQEEAIGMFLRKNQRMDKQIGSYLSKEVIL